MKLDLTLSREHRENPQLASLQGVGAPVARPSRDGKNLASLPMLTSDSWLYAKCWKPQWLGVG